MASRWWVLLALLPLLRLLKARPGKSREAIVLPKDERVVLLGASSGVGRELAHVYAKRGARICLVARRQESLEKVKKECEALGLPVERVLLVPANITSTDDLRRVRDAVIDAWGGLDTLHILAGVPSTRTLMELAGTNLVREGESKWTFEVDGTRYPSHPTSSSPEIPKQDGLEKLAEEVRACAEINFVGTALALATFIPLLAASSPSPAIHHLSSVAATIAAPSRAVYSATKAAGYMVTESCRVECEGSGIRFFSLLPGTIDNEFRTKTALSQTGGNCEVEKNVKHTWEKLLLKPEKVTETIIHHLALPPAPAPLIPYPPFSWIPSLRVPPPSTLYLPFTYRLAQFAGQTSLGWLYVEPSARRKYALPNM